MKKSKCLIFISHGTRNFKFLNISNFVFSRVLNILKRDNQCHFQNNGNAKHVFPYERGSQMIYMNQGLQK